MGTTPAHTVDTAQPSQSADIDALIHAYAPHVKYLAQRLASRLPASICLDDLISTGVLGLMDAIAKYDPTRGTTFKTYAAWRMRGAMLDELREMDWVPRSVRLKEHALTQAYAALERQGCNRSRNTTCKLSSCGMLTWFKIMVIGDLNRRRCR